MSFLTKAAPPAAMASGTSAVASTTQGPLSAVLAACTAGASTLAEVAEQAGLAADVVETAVDYLVQTGRLYAAPFTGGCPTGGCGGCPVATSGPGPGCGTRSGAGLLTLGRRDGR